MMLYGCLASIQHMLNVLLEMKCLRLLWSKTSKNDKVKREAFGRFLQGNSAYDWEMYT